MPWTYKTGRKSFGISTNNKIIIISNVFETKEGTWQYEIGSALKGICRRGEIQTD
jgi:hypothetical protein